MPDLPDNPSPTTPGGPPDAPDGEDRLGLDVREATIPGTEGALKLFFGEN